MHASIRELARLKLRSKVYSLFLGIGILAVTFAIIIGLRKEDPLVMGIHLLLLGGGIASVLVGLFLHQNEETFAQKYDMTHLLDIDDRVERFEAYMEHLSEWISSDIEELNPIRTRGSDPTGPDWGKTDFKLGHEPVRRDAIVEGGKYSGLEGELTSGEKMVAAANTEYAESAQKRWERAEANDPDLIEYGVERLGDLVRTEYFEKNAEDGAFSKVANQDSDSQ
ncbi:MAG: hypothetical protein CMA11_03075 [Euryarchaeota archaeon]|nr:hypothetical protein [Euryarchaeota archaeon]